MDSRRKAVVLLSGGVDSTTTLAVAKATRAGVEGRHRLTIHTPLIELTKAQLIRRGLELGVDYSLTSSCYDPAPAGEACGECDACLLRLKGFAESGNAGPAPYLGEARVMS